MAAAAGASRPRRRSLSVAEYVAGIRRGDATVLARAITLVESKKAEHVALAQQVLQEVLPDTGGARRVGVTGSPGVGKSTFIEALGMRLVDEGRRVAVLAVDPSSSITGGSILGDKTRMARLSQHPKGFIRPSPSDQTLGGVARRTRESMLLCEAAGFDVVLVETVGVGQSEVVVSDMVDFFLVLMLPGGGDELQGIKKGILELADLVAVNKADGDRAARARETQREYAAALRYAPRKTDLWTPTCVTVSALEGTGLDDVWDHVERHRKILGDASELASLRREQLRRWMRALVEERLLGEFFGDPVVRARLPELERAVVEARLTPVQAATELLAAARRAGEG